MERYTQFRDKATGISPFIPVTQTNVIGVSDSSLQQFIKTSKLDQVGGFLLFLVRVVFALPFILISVLVSNMIGFSKTVALNRFILFIFGLNGYELSIENLKTKKLNRAQFYPSKGEIYFVNFSSPLDVLLLSIVANDEFVLLIPDKSGELQQVSKSGLISKSVAGLDVSNASQHPLEYKILKGKIIFIFAEGTTSNGKSILPFLLTQEKFNSFLSKLNDSSIVINKITSIGMKHYPSTLVTPLGSTPFKFFYKVLTSFSFNSKLRINTVNEVNPLENSLVKIRNSFTNNGKFKLISEEFNIDMKSKFISTYRRK
jgi:hypothetical protein